jgi:SIR2-like domain
MELEDAIEHALDGDAILFVGAGFSVGAINLKGERFLTGSELASVFAARAGLPSNTSLEDAAEAYEEKFGTDALIRELQQEFTASKLQPYHREIARFPWKRIFTTNYDNVLELAYSTESKKLVPITLDRNIYAIPKQHTICVHLNGYVDILDRNNLDSQLKLTEPSYVTSSVAESPWAMLFRQDIRLAKAIFFLGYSLYDLDIKRLLVESPHLYDKTFYVIGKNPDAATQRRTSRYGSVLNIDVQEIAQLLSSKRSSYQPPERAVSLSSINEHTTVTVRSPLTDKNFLDLLAFGVRTDALVSESLHFEKTFFLERSETHEVFHLIDSGERIIAISSDLGNGKSLFLDGIRLRALEKGFRVFDVRERVEEAALELESIAKLPDKILVTIEEYQNWLPEIRSFRINASDQAVLIVTARNFINDLAIDDLLKATGNEDVSEIRIDSLDDQEINWFVEALNEYGLWGSFAGQTKQQKTRYLKQNCSRQVHAILLKLFDSPDIGTRLRALSDGLRTQRESYEVLLGVFVLTVLNQMPTIDMLTDIWGPELIGSVAFRRNTVVQQFVDFQRYEILVRSPVSAQYLLRRIADPNLIVNVLIKMAKRANAGAAVSPQYRSLYTTLMKFSSLQLILPEDKPGAVITYYETIKNLEGSKSNVLFWLQYAIACLVIGDLQRAKKYFDTSYSLAEERGWDTFQIDNHFARFLLVQAVDLDHRSALENFRSARNIINRQIRDERLHYPYRVAIQYQSFFDTFARKFSSAELFEISTAAKVILDQIQRLPVERKKHRYVSECAHAMGYIVVRANEMNSQVPSKED